MLVLEHGIVEFFKDRRGQNYGFLRVLDEAGEETGESIFFHLNDGQWVEIVGEDIEFVGCNFPEGGPSIYEYPPSKGDKLAFQRAPGKPGKGPKASPWTHAEAYDNRVRTLAEPFYRVVKCVKYGYNDATDTREVIWQDRGAMALSRQFPVRVLDGELDDPLARDIDFAAGRTIRYVIEMCDSDGDVDAPNSWRVCSDPRYMSEEAQRIQRERVRQRALGRVG